jgi:hypothetical protein
MDLSAVPTCTLVEELIKREGVEKITAEPYQKYSVDCATQNISDTGPAIILVITD